MAIKRDYYEVLGISRNANDDEIKKAYKSLALKWHPDKNQDKKEEASDRFKEIGEAYSVISNKDKRSAFDRYGHNGRPQPQSRPASTQQQHNTYTTQQGGPQFFYQSSSGGFPQNFNTDFQMPKMPQMPQMHQMPQMPQMPKMPKMHMHSMFQMNQMPQMQQMHMGGGFENFDPFKIFEEFFKNDLFEQDMFTQNAFGQQVQQQMRSPLQHRNSMFQENTNQVKPHGLHRSSTLNVNPFMNDFFNDDFFNSNMGNPFGAQNSSQAQKIVHTNSQNKNGRQVYVTKTTVRNSDGSQQVTTQERYM